MGIETVIGVALAAASAVGGVVQAVSQSAAAKKAASAQKEASAIQTASEQIANRESQRQAIREERIRRAQIAQASENSGVTGSSGQLGAIGSLGTSLGTSVAFQRGQEKAAVGIGRANQSYVNAQLKGAQAAATGQLFQTAVGGFGNIFSNFYG